MNRGLFITSTDTGVGKTLVTCALAHALRERGLDVGVMKPIATGCSRQGRELFSEDVGELIRSSGARDPMELISPYRFEPPVAPWVATWDTASSSRTRGSDSRWSLPSRKREGGNDMGISLNRIEEAFQELATRHELVLVEGIGGIFVPINGNQTVADLARRLGLPVLIVARAGLGTINHTLLTLEAASQSGLEVLGVVFNGRATRPDLAQRTNPQTIRRWAKVPILGVVPQLKQATPQKVAAHLEVQKILRELTDRPARLSRHASRLSRIDRETVWHPFTQMAQWQKSEPLIVESGEGVWLKDVQGNRYLDGVSSLWVNLHGHAHPSLDRALRRQLGRIAHSTLLGCANVPSTELANELTAIAPKGLSKVFYSDNGSTAVEVALKMAFQYWQQNGRPKRRRFVHFTNAYHGDTIGSVSVGGIDLFHEVYRPLLFKGFKVPIARLKPLEETLRRHQREIAGVVVEPAVQGAAGMITQPKGWLTRVAQLARRYGTFLIADEVAVGFGRTGTMFACEAEGVRPDFLCLAKGLSAGYLPLAATLTTERVYRGFLGSHASQRTFFHGHSYTGNPLACAVALENLRLFRRERILQRLKPKIRLFTEELQRFADLPHVGEVRQRGLIAGIALVQDKKSRRPYPSESQIGVRVCQSLRARGILLRPLGDVIVLMPPLSIRPQELRFLCRTTHQAVARVTEE